MLYYIIASLVWDLLVGREVSEQKKSPILVEKAWWNREQFTNNINNKEDD